MDTSAAPIELRPIGYIRSPYATKDDMPRRGEHRPPAEGRVELLPEYAEALSDLDGFERIWLIFCFDRSEGYRLRLVPRSDTVERGLFATRAPCRPNPIGLSPVRLLSIDGGVGHQVDRDGRRARPQLLDQLDLPRERETSGEEQHIVAALRHGP